MSSIVAHHFRFVVGVDTHARNHVYALIAADTGEHIQTCQFPTTAAGLRRAIDWVAHRTGAVTDTLWVIEGIASYGALLAGAVAAGGWQVAEAPAMNARAQHGIGKSDPLDARRIADAVRGLDVTTLRRPRADSGVRAALQILLTAREAMTGERTRAVNALTALLRVHDLGIDARRPLTAAQVSQAARWRVHKEPLANQAARAEANRLAGRIHALDRDLTENTTRLRQAVQSSQAAPLLQETGIGPVTAATCLAAWSHPGRVRSEAAFAALAGVNPIPASSGNTTGRHRLNRGGDRRLNRALYFVTITRMRRDPDTKTYVDKRRAEGKTTRDIQRVLKRYLARQIYRTLNKTKPAPNPA
ncbi:transposase [Antricoccus suffuscus]|uniref:Transposase n=1 Tax=Antricoccus suffuscus TaxID=1629062 RepID=A0A2T1A6Q4_9ACTN|nr:IS110 family transposase [Antricoccus suffuscus]PRZ44279.1 transposase [Antricoccus suffuscus]